MKTSSLVLTFCLAVGMAVQAHAKKDETVPTKDAGKTTFAEFDQMTFKEQSRFISERAMLIYDWLEINDPAKAKCMNEKFELDVASNKPPEALIELEKKIKGVSEEDRPKYHVENLMANYIIDNLCASAKTNPAAVEQRMAK